MRRKVADTGEYSFFMTERGFGDGDATPGHPMLRETQYRTADGEPMIANDLFRVVHDLVAHVRGGYSFSTNGEFNGMLTHASTMPESAWPALFAETFGQNAVYERTKGFARQNAYASTIGPKLIRDELDKRRSTSFRSDDQTDSDEPLGYQHIKSRPGLLAELERRAFCSGASPPDNSCSPTNKGTGTPAPAAPSPDGRVASGDTRGALTGHSEEQRRKYYEDLRGWAKSMGVQMDDADSLVLRTDSPMPTMDAIQCAASGLSRLKELGLTLPPRVEIAPIMGTFGKEDALAAYDHASDKVLVNPDFDNGLLVGLPLGSYAATTTADIFVHEITHRDHGLAVGRDAVRKMSLGFDQDAPAPEDTPMEGDRTQWEPALRVATSTTSSEDAGKPLTKDEAYGVAATVSGYATTSPTEFVAELRTALFKNPNRRRFPKAVFTLYEDYGGPPLPDDARPSPSKKRRR
jgi:hypothetical protein